MVWNVRALRLASWIALGVPALVACGGSEPPPQTADNPPPLDDDDAPSGGGAAAQPSSGKVKEGMDAIQAGDFAKAKTVLTEATQANPKDPQAAFYLGVADEGLGDGKTAAEDYRKALSLDPKLAEASTNLSGVLLDLEDAKGALEAAEAGLKVAPKSPSLLRNRAVALDATGSKDAPAAFKAALAAAPKDGEVRYLYGESLARSGDEAGAVKELMPLTESDDVAVLASTGRLLGKLKAFDGCVRALDRAVSKKDVAELRVQRGICKHGKKDDKAAEADFVAATTADPKYAPAHYYLGQQKLADGDKKAAKAELQKAAELDTGALGQAAKKALSEIK
ncbi:MAG TPA: tetratricopeptide repeat protein [Polyangiaceae bacterium]|nr:tetratricopeptide repeat protein [Polyangiaceae bacterium]